jgi:hypothetical protein
MPDTGLDVVTGAFSAELGRDYASEPSRHFREWERTR